MASKRGLRTPLILRIGFLHSYWRTALVVLSLYLLSFLLVWPANLVYVWLSRGLIDLLFIFGLCMFGTWVTRAVVGGFDEFFDAFDEETESKLSLYNSYSVRNRLDKKPKKKERRAAIQADVRGIFQSKKAYIKFQDGIRKIIFPTPWGKVDVLLILSALVCWVLFTIIWFEAFGPRIFSYAGFTVFPWTFYHTYFVNFMNIFWFLIGFSALYLIISYLRAIWLLDSSRQSLIIWKQIPNIQDKIRYEANPKLLCKIMQKPTINRSKRRNPLFMSYPRFYSIVAKIGRHTAWVTLALITIVLIQIARMAVSLEWLRYGTISWATIVLSIFMIPSSILIFLIPQREIHELLMDTKDGLLREWRRIYDDRVFHFFKLFRSKEGHNPSENIDKDFLRFRQEIETIQNLIIETSLEKDWTVGIPATVGVSTISVIPTIITVTQVFFPFWR